MIIFNVIKRMLISPVVNMIINIKNILIPNNQKRKWDTTDNIKKDKNLF